MAAGMAVANVANTLSKILIQEAEVLSNVEERVEWIEREARLMQAYLEHVGRTQQDSSKWQEELENFFPEAQHAIETFVQNSKRRKWVWHRMMDRYRIGKQLEGMRNSLAEIHERKTESNHKTKMESNHSNIRVVVETPEASSSSPPAPAPALHKLSSLENDNLLKDLKEIIKAVINDLTIIQKIMSNLSSTRETTATQDVWWAEVKEVCSFTTGVIENLDKNREEWPRMKLLDRLRLYLLSRTPKEMFVDGMKCVKTQTEGALRRGLTYGIWEEEEGLSLVQDTRGLTSRPLGWLLIQRVIYLMCYLTVFPLLDIWNLSAPLVVLCFLVFVILSLPIMDLWKARREEKLKILKDSFWRILSDLGIFGISYVAPQETVLSLQFGSTVVTSIYWSLFVQKSVEQKLQSIERERALMYQFLIHPGARNERKSIWIKQIELVAEQAKDHTDEHKRIEERCEQFQRALIKKLFLYFRLIVFEGQIKAMYGKMLKISEMNTTYCISYIEESEGVFSSGQSTQGRRREDPLLPATSGSESDAREDLIQPATVGSASAAEEVPLLTSTSSHNNHQSAVKGFVLRACESILHEDMPFMEALFKDVQGMGELDGRSKIWLKEMSGIHHQMELVSKEYKSKLRGKPSYAIIPKLPTIYIIKKKIDQIRYEIQDASRRRKTYGLYRIQTQKESLQSQTHDLPLCLKRCLFYFAQLPQHEISARRLVAWWIAEGLVSQGQQQEHLARSYLRELIDLKMVEGKEKDNGKGYKCRLRDDLRELWLKEKYRNIRVIDKADKDDPWHDHIHAGTLFDSESDTSRIDYNDVLSLLSFDTREGSKPGQEIGNFLDKCISVGYFSLLRVLDLESVYKPQLPKNIGNLSRLRYLGLRWTYLESLPSSVSKLLKLQTLDLKHTCINILTTSIWKMELRHLFLSETYRTRFPPQPRRNYLSDLQTLSGLFVDEKTPIKGGLDKLVNIRKLGLTCQSMSPEEASMKSQLKAVADWITELKQLESLSLKSRNIDGQPWDLQLESLKSHEKLKKMYLLGKLSCPSVLSEFPPKLVELTLSHSKLNDADMNRLGDLLELRSLHLLAGSYAEVSITWKSFPKLHVLKLWKLEQLREWTIEDEALPCLEQVETRSCKRLKITLPDRLKHVRINDVDYWETCQWKFPPTGWVCLNSKGYTIDNSKAACGGLIRDEAGVVLGGFCLNLETNFLNLEVTSELAELWGVLHGLKYAWKMDKKMVSVDIDSDSALSLIKSSSSHESHLTLAAIQGIKDLLKRDWKVEFCHIYPEANRAANKLASMGKDRPLGVVEFISPPLSLAEVIRDDRDGVLYKRKDP